MAAQALLQYAGGWFDTGVDATQNMEQTYGYDLLQPTYKYGLENLNTPMGGRTAGVYNDLMPIVDKPFRRERKKSGWFKEGGGNDILGWALGILGAGLGGSSLGEMTDKNTKEQENLVKFSSTPIDTRNINNQSLGFTWNDPKTEQFVKESKDVLEGVSQTPLYTMTGNNDVRTVGDISEYMNVKTSVAGPTIAPVQPLAPNVDPTKSPYYNDMYKQLFGVFPLGTSVPSSVDTLEDGGKSEDGAVKVNVERNEKKVTYDDNYNIVKIEDVKTDKTHSQGGKDTALQENQAILNEKQYAALKQGTSLKTILDTLPDVSEVRYAQEGVDGEKDEPVVLFNPRIAGKLGVETEIKVKFGGNKEAYYDHLRKKYNIPDFRAVTKEFQTVPIGKFGKLVNNKYAIAEQADAQAIADSKTRTTPVTSSATKPKITTPKSASLNFKPEVPLYVYYEDMIAPETPLPKPGYGYNRSDLGQTGVMPEFRGEIANRPIIIDKNKKTKTTGEGLFGEDGYGYPEQYLFTNLGSNLTSTLYNMFNRPEDYNVPRTEIGMPVGLSAKYESVEPVVAQNKQAFNSAVNRAQELGRPELIPLIVRNFNEKNEEIYAKLASINAAKEQQINAMNVQIANQIRLQQAGLDAERVKLQTGVDLKQSEVDRERINQINESLFNLGRAWADYDLTKEKQAERKELMRLYEIHGYLPMG